MRIPLTVLPIVLMGLAGGLSASPILFSGTSGSLGASVLFDDSTPGTLVVTLTNTSPSDVLVPADVLAAVFWDSNPSLTLTPTSAVLGGGSTVFFCSGSTCPTGGVVGGEWAYNSGFVGAPGGTAYGISASGFGLFGPPNLFPGPNLQGPESPDGLQYGILSAGDDPTTGNAPVTGDHALIKNSVVFTLTGLPLTFDASTAITNVQFQYGTSLTEPSFPPGGGGGGGFDVPEPASVSLFLAGAIFLLGKRFKWL